METSVKVTFVFKMAISLYNVTFFVSSDSVKTTRASTFLADARAYCINELCPS